MAEDEDERDVPKTSCLGISRLPFLSREKFYDDDLSYVNIYPYERYRNSDRLYPVSRIHVSQSWSIMCDEFIDAFINKRGMGRWYPVPGFSPADFPCFPGTVALVNRSVFSKNKAYFAGTVNDFYPANRDIHKARPLTMLPTRELPMGRCRKVYRARRSNKAVVITAESFELASLDTASLKKDQLFIDISNFEYTNFDHRKCYVVTKVITCRSMTLEMSQDGHVWYEVLYDSPKPVCFQVAKVKVVKISRDRSNVGVIKSISHVTAKDPFIVRPSSSYRTIFNQFLPNQERLGHSVGDNPARLEWREPPVRQSYRPHEYAFNISRSIQTEIAYFNTEEEFLEILLRVYSTPQQSQRSKYARSTGEDIINVADELDDEVSNILMEWDRDQ